MSGKNKISRCTRKEFADSRASSSYLFLFNSSHKTFTCKSIKSFICKDIDQKLDKLLSPNLVGNKQVNGKNGRLYMSGRLEVF